MNDLSLVEICIMLELIRCERELTQDRECLADLKRIEDKLKVVFPTGGD
jgi:hypothetical protein